MKCTDTICHKQGQGRRPKQEDRGACLERGNWKGFAVFDGHGGSVTAEWLKQNGLEILLEALSSTAAATEPAIRKSIRKSIFHMEFTLRALKVKDGSTALFALVYLKKWLVLVNVGDSRGLAVTINPITGEEVRSLETSDHSVPIPTSRQSKEFQKFLKYYQDRGATVTTDGYIEYGDYSLNMTRSLGDFSFKKSTTRPASNIVSPEPDIYFYSLDYSSSYKTICLLATDGLWGSLNRSQVMRILKTPKSLHAIEQDLYGTKCDQLERSIAEKDDNYTIWLFSI